VSGEKTKTNKQTNKKLMVSIYTKRHRILA